MEIRFKLGQFPQWNYLIDLKILNLITIRNTQLDLDKGNIYEEFVEKILFNQLPVVYLEAYSKLQKKIEETQWPKSPKVIFSSNPEITMTTIKLMSRRKQKEVQNWL